MPYLKPQDKKTLKSTVATLCRASAHISPDQFPGVLNYLISQIISARIKALGPKYHLFNEIIGALECAKHEIYRRLVVAHEKKKIIENGDVF